ncbi:MAG: hypothetical protein H6832_12505 [Planctomycetes bacterium]|nr:hypothetical protein [Planctomycetota bacterium]MCB9919214.1 hypothetical protein [Planctomycetota bacterium]
MALRKTVVFGWYLLAISLPAGLTLEALHALKVQVYLGSDMRRELWTLAHAHGNILGILCLVYAVVADRYLRDEQNIAAISRWLRVGSALMPLGFFLGGVLNFEGDPSLGVLLVPIGGLCLLVALVRAALAAR